MFLVSGTALIVSLSAPLLFLDDLLFYADLFKWLVLFYMAYWLYTWVRDKMGFSQIATFAVAGVLIYYLVIEHPLIGAFGIFGWIILTGGILYVLGMIPSVLYMFKRH